MRLDTRRADSIKQGGDQVGMRGTVTVHKNKVAPPFRGCEFDIKWTEGISKSGNPIDVGTEMGLVKKRGAHYAYGESKIGRGRENAKEFLRQHAETMVALEGEIRANAKKANVQRKARQAQGDEESTETKLRKIAENLAPYTRLPAV